jgi:hypothetical protein
MTLNRHRFRERPLTGSLNPTLNDRSWWVRALDARARGRLLSRDRSRPLCDGREGQLSGSQSRDGALVTPLGKTRKAVGAPVLAADAMMDKEEPVWIVFRLDGPQLRIVLAPELLPPRGIEEIALVEIRA